MSVLSVPIEINDERIESSFRLVNIVAQRAKELQKGGTPKIVTSFVKPVTIAIEEALANKLEFITGAEAKEALEAAKKMDYKKFLDEKRREREPEDLSELEKDLKFYLNEKEDNAKQNLNNIFKPKTEQ